MSATLDIAEIAYESGAPHFRYTRVKSPDGTQWLRHGLFIEYSEAGTVISEGSYSQGKEEGLWRDFHPNGKLAAEGTYRGGLEDGQWRFWNESGAEERSVVYERGVERAA